MKNPFQYGGIVAGPYFADRSREIKELVREMETITACFWFRREDLENHVCCTV